MADVCTIECCIHQVLTLVKVPVLSEQTTVTDPSVSAVFNDLHSTLFRFMIFAVMVRLDTV